MSTTAMVRANDNALDATEGTPTLDLVLDVLRASIPQRRWALEGWAAHLRAARHQNHAASSYAKHEGEFTGFASAALALTIARCGDFGVAADEARALVAQRRAARAAKAGAS